MTPTRAATALLLSGLMGCLYQEQTVPGGVVPPGQPLGAYPAEFMARLPRAADPLPATPVPVPSPSTPPEAGRVRLSGALQWQALPYEQAEVRVWREADGQRRTVARTTLSAPGAFQLELPADLDEATLQAWLVSSSDASEVGLSTAVSAPVTLHPAQGLPASVPLALGAQE